ncbi:WD repeat-containing protein [Sodiomyces alkalinus F11]|uniref:WD repeat-containing protein n=1 Tax=Sodiomyces alkalinus (strain CBS 110278 / VKM F-3762 / F11) TaxID=1314773 RepID=A0A3N2PSV2_SODAK|nr:WD repeat-containing protein [Sodiomyces alkalinus F11]ROT37595.1 WD repeat-containing protein [Sodiomyces alkalinus F11]
MPSFDQIDPPKKGKIIKSAFDSESFDSDGTIHVDGLVGSATISPSGRDVALASPEGLAIIDLDCPYNPPRRLSSHGLPWLVTDVQWSPFAIRDYWIVSTANHQALVWNLNLRDDSSSGAIEHSLQGHSRAITDVNFSAHHPDLLATCAVDGYVHCWDLRRPKQPVLSFCDWFAGATQVKYNRQDQHILASSHDRWLHIWDDRKAVEPLRSISAHTSKIYGVDWNRFNATAIVTCSLDKSIKFWDYSNDTDAPSRVISTPFPVWRARHTPFGRGMLAMPQNEPGDLYLYDRRVDDDAPVDTPPVAIFPGHGNHKVKEFLWRSRGGITEDGLDNRDFQLVSWGADNELRLQRIDAATLESVGYKKGEPAAKNLNLTRKGATYKTFRTMEDSINRDWRSATMSDARPGGAGTHHRQSTLTMSMRSNASTHYNRIGSAWKGASMKARNTQKQIDRSQAQIGWMKGITMTKKKSASDAPLRGGDEAKASPLFNPGYPDEGEWGEPETVHDELLRVSTQLPKVKWEHIDMDALTLNASLYGPWGRRGETIFIQVRVDIPTTYPKSKAPKFFVEKTSFMPDEVHGKIDVEIHQLARKFLERKQNCLDVVFSYLLGEVDLESSTTFFKNVKDLDDDVLDGLADESSSEESDLDIPTGGSVSMSQELAGSAEMDGTLAPTNRPTIPPMPRFCGGRFSNDGKLVCFFPTKEEKAKALFSMPPEALKERPKGEPVFAGFGRLGHDSPPHKKYGNDEGSGTEDRSDSDDSTGSSSSSDDSESTSMHKMNLWYQPRHRFRRTWSDSRSVRSSGGGTGIGTGTGTGSLKRRTGAKPKSIVSLHDLSDLQPAKRTLAREYAIFGDGADVCKQNAEVAAKYGYAELAELWRYLALLLRKDIPLEPLGSVQESEGPQDSILVIARDAVARRLNAASTTGSLAHDDTSLNGRVKWGAHPLARDVLEDLFDHFERAADIQMLAMLSCIFGESSNHDGVAFAECHLTQPETPLPMKAPSFSLDYFPTDASLWVLNRPNHSNMTSAITTPRTAHTPIRYSGSQGSEDVVLWPGEAGSNSYSCGETPPTKGVREYLAEATSQIHSLSTSPSGRPLTKPAHSGLTSSFAINLGRSFAVATTTPSSSSPPQQGRKRPSPAETILSNLAPSMMGNLTRGGSAIPGDTGTARTSVSDDEVFREDLVSLVPVGVSVHMEDQGIFDDDGWMTAPLLEPRRQSMYAAYRYAYAEMLQMWGLPLERLEIMKFNVLREEEDGTGSSIRDSFSAVHETTSFASHHKKEQLQSLVASGRGLDVTGVCRVHEIQMEPLKYTKGSATRLGGAVGVCERCRASRNQAAAAASDATQTQLMCVFCRQPVDALFVPCLGCGCASHDACMAEWHAQGETHCPAGDECNCAREASNGQVESWAAIMAAVRKGQQPLSSQKVTAVGTLSPPAEVAEKEKGWESVASSREIPSRPYGFGGGGSAVMSAARLSLGHRLKKAGDWSRASSIMRREDGGSGKDNRGQ